MAVTGKCEANGHVADPENMLKRQSCEHDAVIACHLDVAVERSRSECRTGISACPNFARCVRVLCVGTTCQPVVIAVGYSMMWIRYASAACVLPRITSVIGSIARRFMTFLGGGFGHQGMGPTVADSLSHITDDAETAPRSPALSEEDEPTTRTCRTATAA